MTDEIVFQILVTIFAAGVVYGKVQTVERKLSKLDEMSERMARLETEVENLKQVA